MFKKDRPRKQPRPDALNRVATLERDELIDWADTTLSNLCQYVLAYRRERNPDLLTEAVLFSEVLFAILLELNGRAEKNSAQAARQVSVQWP